MHSNTDPNPERPLPSVMKSASAKSRIIEKWRLALLLCAFWTGVTGCTLPHVTAGEASIHNKTQLWPQDRSL
jgi:hypothetical protein